MVLPIKKISNSCVKEIQEQGNTKLYTDLKLNYKKGIDGSCKPALVQDTDYMVVKTYHLAPYLGPFRAYLML